MEKTSEKDDNEYIDSDEVPSDTDYRKVNANQGMNRYQMIKKKIVYQTTEPIEEKQIYEFPLQNSRAKSNYNSQNYGMDQGGYSYKIQHNYKTNTISQSKKFIPSSQSQRNYKIEEFKYYNNQGVSEPRDSVSKKKYATSVKGKQQNRYYSSRHEYSNYNQNKIEEIPRVMMFYKTNNNYSRKKKNIEKMNMNRNYSTNTNLRIKKKNLSELVEIPRSEYRDYRGNNTIFIGGGMDTGEYKFNGTKIIIKEKQIPEEKNIIMNQEDIYERINKLKKNNNKNDKKVKYEILDRFYATTEFDGKPIIQVVKEQKNQKQFIQENEYNNYNFSQNDDNNNSNKNSYEYEYNYEKSYIKNLKNSAENKNFNQNENNNFINYNYNSLYNYGNNFRYNRQIISPNDNYSKYILEQINKIRTDPQSFIGIIEDSKANIINDKHGRLIYNGKIRIALTRGESAFDDAIEFLKNLNPMEKLEFNQSITVESPSNEKDIKDKDYMRTRVENMMDSGINIKSYWRDVIRDPEISFLLMIVDDNGIKSGMRRNDILNPKMKYIGISSVENRGSFACYITLSTGL